MNSSEFPRILFVFNDGKDAGAIATKISALGNGVEGEKEDAKRACNPFLQGRMWTKKASNCGYFSQEID